MELTPIVDLKEAGITDMEYSNRIAKLMERAGAAKDAPAEEAEAQAASAEAVEAE